MKTKKSIFIALSLALLMTDAARSMEEDKKISETRKARCLIQVTSDPAIFPINYSTIEALMYSSGVGGRAVREIFQGSISPDEPDIFTVDILEPSGGISPPPASGMGPTGLAPKPSTGSRAGATKPGLDEVSGDEYGVMREEYGVEMGSGTSPSGASSRTARSRYSSSGTGSSKSRSSSYGKSAPTMKKPGETRFQYIPGETIAQYQARRRAQAAGRSRRSTSTAQTAPATAAISAVGQTSLLELMVDLPDEAMPAAEELSMKIVELFKDSLMDSFDHHRRLLGGHLDAAEEEVKLTENELRAEQDKLREISGSRVLDGNEILRDISDLRNLIENLEMQQASEQLTVDATLKRIAEIESKTKTQIAEDTVTAELERMLELNTVHLQRTKELFEEATVSMAEVAIAEAKLARAKIELARRREELSKSAGGNLLESLNKKLADHSIRTAADKAYLATHERRLAEAEELLSKSSEYELISLRADIAKQNLREVLVWRDRISRHMRMLRPPSVSVLGGR